MPPDSIVGLNILVVGSRFSEYFVCDNSYDVDSDVMSCANESYRKSGIPHVLAACEHIHILLGAKSEIAQSGV